jgi:RNA polymerase sigma-70 factor (ECF subfamily)
MVRRVLTRGLGPGSDVEDLVQEVFLLFFKNVARVRQEGSIRSYILAVTVNALRGELRARTARRWLHLRPAAELPEQAFEAIDEDARELVRRFYRVLDGLSANERALFVLRFVELRSLPEVAAALGVSLATVKRKIPGVARKVHARAARDPLLATRLEGMPRWSYEGQS